MADTKADAKAEARAKERADKAPLTGALSTHDVLRHLIHFGPGRTDAERAELLGPVNADDPDYTTPEVGLTPEQKAAEYDRLKAQDDSGTAPDLTLSEREELDRLRKSQPKDGPPAPPQPVQPQPVQPQPVTPAGGNA